MKILITSSRAPVTIEWVKIMRKYGHTVILCDSSTYPLINQYQRHDEHIQRKKIAAPRWNNKQYQRDMLALIEQVDLVIPTCEDIFYLAQLPLTAQQREKCFMPSNELLFQLHHKYHVFKAVPQNTAIRLPKTRMLTSSTDIDQENIATSVLKPVFSRFGESVIRKPSSDSLKELSISAVYPWVQQEFVSGQGLCNFAICQNGQVIDHAIYRPRHALNDGASTYFERVYDVRIDEFVEQFAIQHQFHGQVAFDFIDDGEHIYLLECNPRSTSGLHLIGKNISYSDGLFSSASIETEKFFRLGKTLFLFSGWRALRTGTFSELVAEYKQAVDVIADIPNWAVIRSFMEQVFIAMKHRISLTSASTYDIEFNGTEERS